MAPGVDEIHHIVVSGGSCHELAALLLYCCHAEW